MASLKEMRNRINSVKATQKITKAMQMVAAAKLKRATDQAESARPYAARMAAVIANLASGIESEGAPRTLVEVDFKEVDEGTQIDLIHDFLPEGADRDALSARWQKALDAF